jgi:MYXO-CTERM domain-containing protein
MALDPGLPPTANRLVPGDNGRYIELDEDGVPLGEWHWNDDTETWEFDEYPPLGKPNPSTRHQGPLYIALSLGAALLALGAALALRRRVRHPGAGPRSK